MVARLVAPTCVQKTGHVDLGRLDARKVAHVPTSVQKGVQKVSKSVRWTLLDTFGHFLDTSWTPLPSVRKSYWLCGHLWTLVWTRADTTLGWIYMLRDRIKIYCPLLLFLLSCPHLDTCLDTSTSTGGTLRKEAASFLSSSRECT